MEELLELLRKAAERTAAGQVQRLSLHSSISIKMVQHGRTVLRRFCDEAAENARHCTLTATWRENRVRDMKVPARVTHQDLTPQSYVHC